MMADVMQRDRVFDFLVPKVVEGLDLSHGTVLYMEDVSVSFDGFKAINALNFYVEVGELRLGNDPFGLQPGVDDDMLVIDGDNGTDDDGTRLEVGVGEALFKELGKAFRH